MNRVVNGYKVAYTDRVIAHVRVALNNPNEHPVIDKALSAMKAVSPGVVVEAHDCFAVHHALDLSAGTVEHLDAGLQAFFTVLNANGVYLVNGMWDQGQEVYVRPNKAQRENPTVATGWCEQCGTAETLTWKTTNDNKQYIKCLCCGIISEFVTVEG